MNGVGQPERVTQNRVIALFLGELGYRYLGAGPPITGWVKGWVKPVLLSCSSYGTFSKTSLFS